LVSDLKSYAKPSGKYPPKKAGNSGPKENESPYSSISVQSKLVLLTLQFPRLRIIWSSSPFVTSEIFADLKRNHAEPDVVVAIRMGADPEDPELGAGINQAAEELLRALPGVTSKNVKHVMGKVGSIKELCELDLRGVQRILGDEPGKACWDFMHKGDRDGAK
jgi:DNA excision repair protein ERCC-4